MSIENETIQQRQRKQDQLDIPSSSRKVVLDRDGMCCRVCGSFRNLEIHHIVPRSQGRNHDYCNLILLCDFCHDMVEKGQLPHWHHNYEKELYHISPVKGFMHNIDFTKIFCQTHLKCLLEQTHQPPIRAYAYKKHNPVL